LCILFAVPSFAGEVNKHTVLKAIDHAALCFTKSSFGGLDSGSFLAQGAGYSIAVDGTQATIALGTETSTEKLRMSFPGANAATGTAEEVLPEKVNYLIGSDPKRLQTDLPTFGRVRYRNAYSRTDLVWYGNQGRLEYDFVVQPGADISHLRVRFDGARKLSLEADGEARIDLAKGSLRLRLPVVYQEIGGVRKQIAGHYVLKNENEIGFTIGKYDRSHTLIVDPTLIYASYFGTGQVNPAAVTTDALGTFT